MTPASTAADAASRSPVHAIGAPSGTPATRPAPDEPALTALSVEVQSAFDYMPATLAGMAAAAAVVTLLFGSSAPGRVLAGWLLMFGALWLLRLLLMVGFRRAARVGVPDWSAWRRIWNATTLLSGAIWGATAWLLYGHGDAAQQTGLVVLVYTYCIAAVPVLANQPRLFLVFASLCFVPLIARIAADGDGHGRSLAAELLLIVTLTTMLARNYRQALQRVTDLTVRADGLLAQLRREKAAADDARHVAEVANRAKTQFFAAASHDLRQPLHAMGLFAGALRRLTREREVAQLVQSIDESVEALDDLFSELLDITRIDSGGVGVRPVDFGVGDLLHRLELHFGPTAFEKGIALRLRGAHHAVHADPILVERILRNLVSNAIRYTDDGSVLVGFRRRGGRIEAQVWDSGVGIPAAEQTRIFEEFYQVPGRPAATPDQRKGLGLGLSIVARLAALIDAPLSLRSQPGRGTVFTLSLPCAAGPSPSHRAAPPDALEDFALQGVRIVAVDDEPAARKGLDLLLTGWGARVVALDSLADLDRWIGSAGNAEAPHLVIVDHRLADGQDGVEAIVRLRARFGKRLPAIVTTGRATAADEARSRVEDFHVLVKPVAPNRLRSLIAFKLASVADARRAEPRSDAVPAQAGA